MVVVCLLGGIACGGGGSTPTPTPTPVPTNSSAVLSASASAVAAHTTAGDTELIVVPPSGSAVTTFQADLALGPTSHTGDTLDRAVLGLRFQPVADRVGNDYTNVVYLRIALESSSAGIVAQRYYYECTNADCSTTQSVGKQIAGSWGLGSFPSVGVPITAGTTYRARISWDPATKVVTYALTRAGNPVADATVDLLQGVQVSPALAPPFDVSSASFMSAYLASQVRGGAAGGGDGAITARFDDVLVGLDGQAASLWDDFESGAVDLSHWRTRGAPTVAED